MFDEWTAEALQHLHNAIRRVDYHSLFAYYDYRFGSLNEECWLIAKALQQVTNGELHYVEVKVDALHVGLFVHTVVRLCEDTFVDGRGVHTSAQLLSQWSHLANTKTRSLSLQPLFFFPHRLERNTDVIEALARTITQQHRLQREATAAKRTELCELWLTAANQDNATADDTERISTDCGWGDLAWLLDGTPS
ncbi:MAG: hypothetical protein RBJ76_05000 [Stenomitos frigidus ULC029]